nr:type II CAAX endopeptidase family protein [Laspinema sp. D2d]
MNWIRFGDYPAPGRLAIFVAMLLGVWVPLAVPIYWLVPDPNWVSILSMAVLYGEFILLVRFWGSRVYGEPQILKDYGLEFSRNNGQDLLGGLGLGLLTLFGLLVVEGLLGWLGWQLPNPTGLPKVLLEGLAIALGVGFAEELLFRGWLFDELKRDYRPAVAIAANTIIFALLHFIKPIEAMIRNLPAFPGLLLLGLTLLAAKRVGEGRLGLPIGFHGGLVCGYYIINTGQLVEYSESVPQWITGMDQNPIAGISGIFLLSAIALGMYGAAQFKLKREK